MQGRRREGQPLDREPRSFDPADPSVATLMKRSLTLRALNGCGRVWRQRRNTRPHPWQRGAKASSATREVCAEIAGPQ